MAPTLGLSPNYSLFAIPAYFLLAFAPHGYSVTLLATADQSKSKTPSAPRSKLYNVSNPRSSQNANKYSSSLSQSTYARYERARAAHSNMFENAGFVVSAILAGVMAKSDPVFMNRVTGFYLFTRVAYLVSYISVERGVLAYLRTLWYFAGCMCLFTLWWDAGCRVMVGDY